MIINLLFITQTISVYKHVKCSKEFDPKFADGFEVVEEKDDMVLNRKVDKIEKMLSRLGTNIEKLTSYVDED